MNRTILLHLVGVLITIVVGAASAQVTTETYELGGGPTGPAQPPGGLPINYHVLHNGVDTFMAGVGSGGGQTALDGIGTWIPGEDIRGGVANVSGVCRYQMTAWRETVCIPAGTTTIEFPLIAWMESAGGPNTAHDPLVFPKPVDPACVGFPLSGSNNGNFLQLTLPGSGGDILVPNEGLSHTPLIIVQPAPITVPSQPGTSCWVVQFEVVGAPVESVDATPNGWWHWARNSTAVNQHWGLSDDELGLWISKTIASDNALAAVTSFTANVEYGMQMATAHPNTHAATLPAGTSANGAYYQTTSNIIDGVTGAPTINVNGGFDIAGHGTLSLSGTSGSPNPNTGLGNQDPAAVGGVAPSGAALIPTLGFWTFDAGPTGVGTKRVTWIQPDFDNLLGIDPALASPIVVGSGAACLPITSSVSVPGIHASTFSLLGIYTHETYSCPTCPDPDRFGAGAFGVPSVQGGSAQIPLPALQVCTSGLLLPLEYGTTTLIGTPGVGASSGGLTFVPSMGASSGSKVIYVMD